MPPRPSSRPMVYRSDSADNNPEARPTAGVAKSPPATAARSHAFRRRAASLRNVASEPHARSRNVVRASDGRSSAPSTRRWTSCQCSGVAIAQLLVQPPTRLDPVACDRALRDAECCRYLWFCHAAEKTTLDDARLAGIEDGQPFECFVHRHENVIALIRR